MDFSKARQQLGSATWPHCLSEPRLIPEAVEERVLPFFDQFDRQMNTWSAAVDICKCDYTE